MTFEVIEDCPYLKKMMELLPTLKNVGDDEEDIPESISGSSRGDYLQRRAHRRHTGTNYEDILNSDEWFDENGNHLSYVCFWKGICPLSKETEISSQEECETQWYAYQLLKERANEISGGW